MLSTEELTPKLWKSVPQKIGEMTILTGDCACGGACATSMGRHPIDSMPLYNELSNGRQITLPKSIFEMNLSEDYCIICKLDGDGIITVLNATATNIFHRFNIPVSLEQAKISGLLVTDDVFNKTVAHLLQLGLLRYLDEPTKSVYWRDPEMLIVWLQMTNQCNLACPYCFVEKEPIAMSEEVINQTVRAIFRSASKHGFRTVGLKYSGGEPGLILDRVLYAHDLITRLADKYQIELYEVILSNGTTFTIPTARLLTERQIGVMISLDGVSRYHDIFRYYANGQGTFKRVNRSIELLLSYGIHPHISITITNSNLSGLPQLMEYLKERNLPFNVNFFRENDYSARYKDLKLDEDAAIIAMKAAFHVLKNDIPQRSLLGYLVDRANLAVPHRYTCGVGQNYLIFDPYGGVAKCQMDMQQTITTYDADDPLSMIQKAQQGISNLPVEQKEDCWFCNWRYWCTGGCPLQSHRSKGSYSVRSPYCNIYKSLFPEVLQLEALRLIKYEEPWLPVSSYQSE